MEQRLRSVREAMGPEDHLLVTGDVVDDGHPLQYEEAKKLLGPFSGKLVLVPGNHDFGPVGWGYQEHSWLRFLQLCSDLGCPVRLFNGSCDIGGTRLILLSSCLKTGHPFDFAQGEVGEAPRHWMAEQIRAAAATGMRSLVALHHHINDSTAWKLQDADEFIRETWGHADFVLFGHKHEEWIWRARVPPATLFHGCIDFKATEALDKVLTIDLDTGTWELVPVADIGRGQ